MTQHLEKAPTLALVLSDFGRDATLRFCALLAESEREWLKAQLPHGAKFFDEHRRMTLSVVGDLPFAKAPTLERYVSEGKPLDDGVLIGFPGGPPLESVTARLGVLVLEAMAGPLRRGCRRAVVLLPCNTLAPTSWALEELFREPSRLEGMVRDAGLAPWPELKATVEILATGEVDMCFPTVPGAVAELAAMGGAGTIVPWGTESICEVYAEALSRAGHESIRCAGVEESERPIVLKAIRAAIDGALAGRQDAKEELSQLARQIQDRTSGGVLIVEACTDLDYGVGLDSVAALADVTIREVYESNE